MSDIQSIIAQIRELLPKVTPGPWTRFVPDRGYCIDYVVTEAPEAKSDERHSDIVAETTNSTGPRGASFFEHDSAYIALLDPVTVTALLDRIEELENYRRWYDDAMLAANEAGFGPGSAADAIRSISDDLNTAEAKLAEARAVIEALRPPQRGSDCWCWYSHDIKRCGHQIQCVDARAALDQDKGGESDGI